MDKELIKLLNAIYAKGQIITPEEHALARMIINELLETQGAK